MGKRPFVVKVIGDTMIEAKIRDGGEVLIDPAAGVNSGDSVLVCFGKRV